jgi:hypothetical protein
MIPMGAWPLTSTAFAADTAPAAKIKVLILNRE